MPLVWTYGVTTVPKRRNDLLPRTLQSLALAGFDKPRLFVDGDVDIPSWQGQFTLEVTTRTTSMRTFGNWILGLAELYIRNPNCDRYAMFQDDLVAYRNLRQYLEEVPYPPKGYQNLYTFPANQTLFPKVGKTVRQQIGWRLSNQRGLGAVGLVFSREAVTVLLVHQHIVDRPQDAMRGWKSIDGGIVTAFRKAGWAEYVHNPSLIQHTGLRSSMGNKPHAQAKSFRGEAFNAMDLIEEAKL